MFGKMKSELQTLRCEVESLKVQNRNLHKNIARLKANQYLILRHLNVRIERNCDARIVPTEPET